MPAPCAKPARNLVRRMSEGRRFRNFDMLRLVAAASVIFSHSFLIVDGHERNEPILKLTGYIVGIYGVFVFLIVSGYLVTQSLFQSSSFRDFAWKRALRIYPALVTCALVCAVIIAPFYSTLLPVQYLLSLHWVRYVVDVVLLYDVYEIPTVRFHEMMADGIGASVNGSLWSIGSEIHCYVLLGIIAALEFLSLRTILAGLVVASAGLLLFVIGKVSFDSSMMDNIVYTFPSFCAGSAMYFIRRRGELSGKVALLSLAAFVLAARSGYLVVLFPFLAAYPIVYLGLSQRIRLGNAARFGDLSYGTYLYGWPMQQVARSLMGPSVNPYLLAAASLPAALACGLLSWHLVEKRALRFKAAARGPTALPLPYAATAVVQEPG